jgi:hypothetical protein
MSRIRSCLAFALSLARCCLHLDAVCLNLSTWLGSLLECVRISNKIQFMICTWQEDDDDDI